MSMSFFSSINFLLVHIISDIERSYYIWEQLNKASSV